jgi:hypothetical protein
MVEVQNCLFGDIEESEKTGVPRNLGKQADWELPSPDLRCFCKSVWRNLIAGARVPKE